MPTFGVLYCRRELSSGRMSNPTCKVREPGEMSQGSSVVYSSMGRNRFRTESLVESCVGEAGGKER